MRVLLAGLNHRTAPVEVRERFAFPDSELAAALSSLRQIDGVREAMVLSTCNRVEITLSVQDEHPALESLKSFLQQTKHASAQQLEPHLYVLEDEAAIRHLFRVASSLDSMVVGEPQILGQMKAAYTAAKEHGSVSGFLEAVLSRAFNVAKRVRNETEIGKSAVSIAYAAVELARQIFGDLAQRRVLVVGAGEMAELAARHLRRSGCGQILVTNRTRSHAEELADVVEGSVVDYETFRDRLTDVDIVITGSGAVDHLLTVAHMRRAMAARRSRAMFLIDIAVPRNIEPAVNELDGAFLYDVDDLGRAVSENLAARQREAEEAEHLIEEEVRRLLDRLKVREIAPTIVGLQHRLDALAHAELDKVRTRLGPLTDAQQQALDAYTRGLLHKIAHAPLTELRRAASAPEGEGTIALIRRLFRLDE
jgi:glutamyl-tRNA reductase